MDYYDNLRLLDDLTYTSVHDVTDDSVHNVLGDDFNSKKKEEGDNADDLLEDWHKSHVVEVIDPNTNEPIRLCHLSALLALSTFGSLLQDADDVATIVYMAIHHFNRRQSLAAPHLSSLHQCNVKFTADLYDCENSASKISQQLTHDVLGDKIYGNPLKEPVPIALIGSNWSSVTSILSKLSSAYKLPQLSHYSSSVEFDSKSIHPFFSRTIPSNEDMCEQYVGFIRTLGVSHLGIIYDRGSFGTSMYKSIEGFALEQGIQVVALPVTFYAGERTTRDIQFAIKELAQTKFRYFFGVVFDMEYYDEVMLEAHRAGIATPQHSWWFPDGIDPEDFQNLAKYPPDSPMVDAMKGVTFVHLRQPHFFERYDAFQSEWNAIRSDPDAVAYIKSKRPNEDLMRAVAGFDPTSYVTSDVPGTHMRLLYDAIIALGIATCHDVVVGNKINEINQSSNRNGDDQAVEDGTERFHYFFDGEEILSSLRHLHMEGATDNFEFSLRTGSRSQVDQKLYSLSSAQPDKELNEDGLATLTMMDIDLRYIGGNMNETSSWTTAQPLLFADGTTTPPSDLPELIENQNLIPNGILGAGWALASICMFLALGLGIWTFVFRHYRAVRASQPEFMLVICFGVVVMAGSIIPAGLQENNVKHVAGLDIACMATPWLLTIGFITSFSVLFAKTWRVNKILLNATFRRVTVKLRDVLAPFVVLLFVNVALLTAWTVVRPLVWYRTTFVSVDEFGRSAESFAVCQPRGYTNERSIDSGEATTSDAISSDGSTTSNPNLVLVFIIPLVACNFASVAFTNYQAFKGRRIKMKINESREIFITMSILLQTLLLGIPVYLTTLNYPTARFMMYAFLITLVCLSILIPLYTPKIKAWRKEHHEMKQGKAGGRRAQRRASNTNNQSRSREHTIVKSVPRRRSSIKSLRSSMEGAESEDHIRMSFADENEFSYVLTAIRNALSIERQRQEMLQTDTDALLEELNGLTKNETQQDHDDTTVQALPPPSKSLAKEEKSPLFLKSSERSVAPPAAVQENEAGDDAHSNSEDERRQGMKGDDSIVELNNSKDEEGEGIELSIADAPPSCNGSSCSNTKEECVDTEHNENNSNNDENDSRNGSCSSSNYSSDESTVEEDLVEKARKSELNFYLRRMNFDIVHEDDYNHPDFKFLFTSQSTLDGEDGGVKEDPISLASMLKPMHDSTTSDNHHNHNGGCRRSHSHSRLSKSKMVFPGASSSDLLAEIHATESFIIHARAIQRGTDDSKDDDAFADEGSKTPYQSSHEENDLESPPPTMNNHMV